MLQALLIATAEPLSIQMVQDVFTRYQHQHVDTSTLPDDRFEALSAPHIPATITNVQIRETLEALELELETLGAPYRLIHNAQGYRLAVAPEYADWVRLLKNEPKPTKLSQSALETLSIIAYRQPVTRPEIEAIRGVSVDAMVTRLMDLELIRIVGKSNLLGKPFHYGTTDRFLEICGLNSLEGLPTADAISNTRLTHMIESSIYAQSSNDTEIPGTVQTSKLDLQQIVDS